MTNFTYYTMALYDYSYGMTDRRKAEYKISLDIVSLTNITGIPMGNGTVIVNQEQKRHEEAIPQEPTLYEKFSSWVESTVNHFDSLIKDMVS